MSAVLYDIRTEIGLTASKRQLWLAFIFPVFTVLALGVDSVFVPVAYFDDRQIANILAILYFTILFWASGSRLRRLMLVMVPLSYIGELLFCKLLDMYEYRTPAIPLYVPFGHAIVYASGYIFANTRFAKESQRAFRRFFAISFLLLFLSVGIFLNDMLSVLSGLLFFILLRRKRWQNMYFFIAACVVFIELAGTCLKCWAWDRQVFDAIPTVNPPMGAVFFYAGGDVLLAKITDLWEKKRLTKRTV
jgi:hypothetical protein